MMFASVINGSHLFFYCYFGQTAHDTFTNLSDIFFDANWIVLPEDLQRYFIMLIENAQIPFYYHGFNILYLNLNVFLMVSIDLGEFISIFMKKKNYFFRFR